MKKKSPPYAIFGAVFLGIIAVVAFVQWKKGQDQAAAAATAQATKVLQDEIDAMKAQQTVAPPTPTNMRNVLYATNSVEAGTKISSAFFEKKPTPVDILPDAYTSDSDIVGFYAIRTIEKGDPLTPHNIGKTLPFLAQRIPPGMRTLSLPVFNADYNATGGFIVDGDRVDLLYTVSAATGDQAKINTQTIMQNVQVLFVPGPKIESEAMDGVVPAPPPGGSVSVTFLVTPEQAQALIFLSNTKSAQFSMILRSRRDTAEVKIKPFSRQDYDPLNLKKVQKTVNKSVDRVNELTKEIEAQEQKQGSQGNTNETTTPTPPSP